MLSCKDPLKLMMKFICDLNKVLLLVHHWGFGGKIKYFLKAKRKTKA